MTALPNKRVLITGAGHGLGKEIARAFASAGAEVLVTDRDRSRVDETVAVLVKISPRVQGYVFDVTSAEQVMAARDQIHTLGGPIDILVNNAGIVYGGAFLDVPLAKHLATVSVNLSGLLMVTHVFLPDLIRRPGGHLVNIASAAALLALPHATAYTASKWAVLGFSDSLREELRLQGHQVRITTICPSFIATGLFAGAKPARLTWLLQPEFVAKKVLQAVESNRHTVILPWTAQLLYSLFRGLPRRLYYGICAWFGASKSMIDWKGHDTNS